MKLHSSLYIIPFVIVACQSKPQEEAQDKTFRLSEAMQKKVQIETVQNQPVTSELTLVGRIVADENQVIEVFPLVGGNVEDVSVELGDYVKKGQTLAVIRSGEVADLERQKIQAQADLLLAQKNLRVAQDLNESKLNSERDVVLAEKEVEQAKAEEARLKELFQIYGLGKSANYVVKSPIAGFVIEKNINRNTQLRSDNSENLFTIGQINDVWVLANVNESDIGKVKLGMEAQIQTLSYPDEKFTGKVDKIYNVLDPNTKAMTVRIRLPNPGYRLKPEMHATITLQQQTTRELPAVSTNAVIFDHSKNYVVVYRSASDLEVREVTIEKSLRDKAYIKAGVTPGEKVISKNQVLVYNAINQ